MKPRTLTLLSLLFVLLLPIVMKADSIPGTLWERQGIFREATFSHDGAFVIGVIGNVIVKLDAATGAQIDTITTRHNSGIRGFQLMNNDRVVVTSTFESDGMIYFTDIVERRIIDSIYKGGSGTYISLSPDNKYLFYNTPYFRVYDIDNRINKYASSIYCNQLKCTSSDYILVGVEKNINPPTDQRFTVYKFDAQTNSLNQIIEYRVGGQLEQYETIFSINGTSDGKYAAFYAYEGTNTKQYVFGMFNVETASLLYKDNVWGGYDYFKFYNTKHCLIGGSMGGVDTNDIMDYKTGQKLYALTPTFNMAIQDINYNDTKALFFGLKGLEETLALVDISNLVSVEEESLGYFEIKNNKIEVLDKEFTKYKIVNILGSEILSSNIEDKAISISDLPNGMYILILESASKSKSFKLMKE